MPDDELEGRTGSPFTMALELGKVREFARATKSSHPDYLDGQSPPIPATFLQTSVFWQGAGTSPWDGIDRNYERLLHGGQEFVFHGPPPTAGTVLTGQTRIDRVYEKAGKRGGTMTFTEVVTEYRDEAGELVAESRSTSIETSKATRER